MRDDVNDGGPAFPVDKRTTRVDSAGYPRTNIERAGGMSLRDHFAGLAMKALITKGMDDYAKRGMRGVPLIPKYAYEYADAMIKERSK